MRTVFRAVGVAVLLLLSVGMAPLASAQFSVIPKTTLDETGCLTILNEFELSGVVPTREKYYEQSIKKVVQNYTDVETDLIFTGCEHGTNDITSDESCKQKLAEAEKLKAEKQKLEDEESSEKGKYPPRDNLLGCAIVHGRISLSMLPHFIAHFSNFLLAFVGIVAVLFIVIGGYLYVAGGLGESKDQGKKFLMNALIGMSLALMSWVIINVIIAAVTG